MFHELCFKHYPCKVLIDVKQEKEVSSQREVKICSSVFFTLTLLRTFIVIMCTMNLQEEDVASGVSQISWIKANSPTPFFLLTKGRVTGAGNCLGNDVLDQIRSTRIYHLGPNSSLLWGLFCSLQDAHQHPWLSLLDANSIPPPHPCQ